MDHPTLLIFVKITIFALMLAIGVNLPLQQLISLWRRPGSLIRSLLAVIVLVPMLVGLLLWVFDLPPPVATGLAVLAAAPGAPLTTKRSQMAGGKMPYSASLQLTLALLAVVVTPLTLTVFYALFNLETETVAPLAVAKQVALVQLLPVGIGLLIQHFWPKITDRVGKPLNVIANILFLLLLALVIVPGVRMILQVGAAPIAAILIMVAVSLAIGFLLGGPVYDERSSLAVASIARNVGLALYIAALSGVEQSLIPTLLSYMILGAIVAVPFSVWRKRRAVRLE